MAQQDLAGTDADDYELQDNIDFHLNNLQNEDENGYNKSVDDIKSDIGISKPGLLSTFGKGITGFNKAIGGGIDAVVDTVGGDIIGNAIGGEQMANNIKNATNAKTFEAPVSIAEDIGLMALSPVTGGVSTGVMIGKNIAEQGANIEKGLNGILGKGIDPVSGQAMDKGQS